MSSLQKLESDSLHFSGLKQINSAAGGFTEMI
nr:MAG TPA: hypothetical protein [Caudoviricetes sp.]